MHSWDSVKPLRSTFTRSDIGRKGLTAGAALLTSVAIVLGVGLLAKKADQATTVQSVERMSITASQNAAGSDSGRLRSDIDKRDASEPTPGSRKLPLILDDAFAQLGFPSGKSNDQDVETPAKQVRQDRGASDSGAAPLASIAGIWAPDAAACSARDFREGLLPTIINADGAWAGDTFCLFRNRRRTDSGWKVVANCSNPHEHWTTEVRLTVKENRLTWTSKRGAQAYTRCAPDFRMAASR